MIQLIKMLNIADSSRVMTIDGLLVFVPDNPVWMLRYYFGGMRTVEIIPGLYVAAESTLPPELDAELIDETAAYLDSAV